MGIKGVVGIFAVLVIAWLVGAFEKAPPKSTPPASGHASVPEPTPEQKAEEVRAPLGWQNGVLLGETAAPLSCCRWCSSSAPGHQHRRYTKRGTPHSKKDLQ